MLCETVLLCVAPRSVLCAEESVVCCVLYAECWLLTGDSHWGPAGVALLAADADADHQPTNETADQPEAHCIEERASDLSQSPEAVAPRAAYPSFEYSVYSLEGCGSPIVWA